MYKINKRNIVFYFYSQIKFVYNIMTLFYTQFALTKFYNIFAISLLWIRNKIWEPDLSSIFTIRIS